MSNYTGVKCPICSKKFIQADDIVVCPICGAPHHRACYAQGNACAFAADHLSGKEWRAPPPDPSHSGGNDSYSQGGAYGSGNSGETVACNMCHAKNPKGTIFCQACGARMSFGPEGFFGDPYMGMNPATIVYGGLRPDEKIEDETARDLAVYIGPSSAYYLPRFKKIADSPYALTFNFAALIFNFFYFFYRKMYLIGGILLGLFVIGSIPSFLYMQEFPAQFLQEFLPPSMHQYLGAVPNIAANQEKIAHYHQLINISGSINFILSIVVAISANRFYYMKAMSDVKRVRESQPEKHDEVAYCGKLRVTGGISKISVIIVTSAYFAIYFIFSSYVVATYLQMLQ